MKIYTVKEILYINRKYETFLCFLKIHYSLLIHINLYFHLKVYYLIIPLFNIYARLLNINNSLLESLNILY